MPNTIVHKIQFNVTEQQLRDIDTLVNDLELGSRAELFRMMIRQTKKEESNGRPEQS